MKAVVLDVVLPRLQEPAPLPSKLRKLCLRLFLVDLEWSQFYLNNGAVKRDACVGGGVVIISAFQALVPDSIPGRRIFFVLRFGTKYVCICLNSRNAHTAKT